MLWLGAMLDHPTFDTVEEDSIRPYAIPWLAVFTPAAACILVMGASSPETRQKSVWHLAAVVLKLPAMLAFIFREREHTMGGNHGHRFLIVSWIFVGIFLGLLALAFAPEPCVSSWLRKFAMLVCCVSYINGGISKVLNNRPLLGWLDGKVLQKSTFCASMVHNIYRGVGYPWLSRQVALHLPLSQLLCVFILLFELPLSFSALVGPGCFGKLGPVRILWCLVACSFHFGVNLLWGSLPASMYNYEMWVILVLVADVFGKCFCWSSNDQPSEVKAILPGTPAASKDTLTALSLLCSFTLFAWMTVAFIRHFDDPKWPITSVPMFSMLCGTMECAESFRASTYNLPWWCAVACGLAGTSIVFVRPARAAEPKLSAVA